MVFLNYTLTLTGSISKKRAKTEREKLRFCYVIGSFLVRFRFVFGMFLVGFWFVLVCFCFCFVFVFLIRFWFVFCSFLVRFLVYYGSFLVRFSILITEKCLIKANLSRILFHNIGCFIKSFWKPTETVNNATFKKRYTPIH